MQTTNKTIGSKHTGPRWARIALYSLLGLIAVVAICLTVILNMDFGRFRGDVENVVTEALGREFAIEGDFIVEIDLRRIRVAASEIRLAGTEWNGEPNLAQVGRFETSVNSLSLLNWPIRIESLEVERVRVNLEQDEAGTGNWELFEPKEQEVAPEEGGPGDLPVIVDLARIVDVALVYDSPERPQPLRFNVAEFAVERDDEDYLDVHLDAALNDTPVGLDVRTGEVGNLVEYHDVTIDFAANLGEIKLEGQSTVDSLLEPRRPTLQLTVSGPSVEYLTEKLQVDPITSGPLNLVASIAPLGDDMQLNINGDVGEFALDVSGQFRDLRALEGVTLRVAASGPDAGAIARLAGNPNVPEDPFSIVANVTRAGPAINVEEFAVNIGKTRFVVNAQISDMGKPAGASVAARIDGPDFGRFNRLLGMPGKLAGPFEWEVNLVPQPDGSAVVNMAANAKDVRVTLAGTVTDSPDLAGTNLRVDFAGPNLRTITDALGLESAPAKPFNLGVDLERLPDGIRLGDGSMNIGDDQFGFSGLVGNAPLEADTDVSFEMQGPNLGATLVAFGVDADELPSARYRAAGRIERGEDQFVLHDISAAIGEDLEYELHVAGNVTDHPKLVGTRVQVSTHGESLGALTDAAGVADMPDIPFRVEASLERVGNGFAIEDGRAQLGADNVDVSGLIGEKPLESDTNLRFNVMATDLKKTLAGFGMDVDVIPPGKLVTSGEIRSRGGQFELRGINASLAGNLEAKADFTIGMTPVMGRGRFSLEANSPDLVPLTPAEYAVLQTEKVPLRLKTSGRWDEKRWTLDELDFGLARGSVVGGGTIGGPPNFNGTDLTIDVNIASLQTLSVLAGRELPDDAAQLKFHLVGSRGLMQLEQFEGRSGDSDFSGRFSLRGGDVPEMELALTSTRLNLTPYLPEDSGGTDEEEAVPAEPKERLIPDTPIPMDQLRKVAATVNVDIKEINVGPKEYTDVILAGSLADGALVVERFAVDNNIGGSLRGNVALRPAGDAAALSLDIAGSNLILGMPAATPEELAGLPRYELDTILVASGTTARELAASLNGYLRLVGGEGRVKATRLRLFSGDFLSEVMNTVNPFAKTDPYTNVQCVVVLAPFEDGKTAGSPIVVVQSDRVRILVKADVDLSTEKFSATINSVPQKGLGIGLSDLVNPFVKLSGTFAKPALTLDPEGALIEGGAAVATAGISILAKRFKQRFIDDKDACGKALREAEPMFDELREKYRPGDASSP